MHCATDDPGLNIDLTAEMMIRVSASVLMVPGDVLGTRRRRTTGGARAAVRRADGRARLRIAPDSLGTARSLS
ncbi:hypothetical protein YT1_1999 [Rhodococcus ruber]|nr:hypothetical protein YT1_1999 [Rhodococcus ruber]